MGTVDKKGFIPSFLAVYSLYLCSTIHSAAKNKANPPNVLEAWDSLPCITMLVLADQSSTVTQEKRESLKYCEAATATFHFLPFDN